MSLEKSTLSILVCRGESECMFLMYNPDSDGKTEETEEGTEVESEDIAEDEEDEDEMEVEDAGEGSSADAEGSKTKEVSTLQKTI